MTFKCDACDNDFEMHSHFIKKPYKFVKPRFNIYKQANYKLFDLSFNRYPHNIIGVYFVIFGMVFVMNWKGSKFSMNLPHIHRFEAKPFGLWTSYICVKCGKTKYYIPRWPFWIKQKETNLDDSGESTTAG